MRLLVILGLVLATGCAAKPWKPDRPHPTWQEIEALAASVQAKSDKDRAAKLRLVVNPRLLVEGGKATVTCYVPEAFGRGKVRLGIPLFSVSGPKPIERVQNSTVVERLSCGRHRAFCEVWTELVPHRRVVVDIEVKGSCDGS